jgi:hypothetical protein
VQISVAIENLPAGDGGDSIAGDDDTGQVHGVGSGYGDDGVAVAGACGAEGFDGFGESVLFAAEAGEEAASADLAAGLKTAEDVEEVAPFGGVRLAGEQIAEKDAIASEELAGEGFESCIGSASLLDCGRGSMEFFGEKRPTAGGAAGGTLVGCFGDGGSTAGVHAGAELIEAVGGGEACGGEFPEGVLGLLAREVGDALNVVGEAGAALLKEGAEQKRVGAEGCGEFFIFDALLSKGVGKPAGGFADVEGDGSGVRGDNATGGISVSVRPRRVGGDTAPAYRA